MKLETFVNEINNSIGKYAISTSFAFIATINWQLFTPVIIQLSLLLIDVARVHWIKEKRAKEIQKVHEFTEVKIEQAKKEIKEEQCEDDAKNKNVGNGI